MLWDLLGADKGSRETELLFALFLS